MQGSTYDFPLPAGLGQVSTGVIGPGDKNNYMHN